MCLKIIFIISLGKNENIVKMKKDYYYLNVLFTKVLFIYLSLYLTFQKSFIKALIIYTHSTENPTYSILRYHLNLCVRFITGFILLSILFIFNISPLNISTMRNLLLINSQCWLLRHRKNELDSLRLYIKEKNNYMPL